MHNMRRHDDGIAECPSCGAVFRLTAQRDRRKRPDGFDCFMCGDRLDTLIATGRQIYELIASPQITRLMKP